MIEKVNIFKNFLIKLWQVYIYLNILINSTNKKSRSNPRLFYAGARKGNKGGPLVKFQKLLKAFPEYRFSFNIIYVISNNAHLNQKSLNLIYKRKLPTILNQNGVYYPAWYNGDWKNENLKLSKVYHLADYVIWQSEFAKKASNKYLGKREKSGEILYNAVDTNIFKPKKKVIKDKFTFLITGNIRKGSNYRILSVLIALKDIVSENRNIYLNISGLIEDKNYFENIIKDMNLSEHINFTDKYSQEQAPDIYNEADAYITMSFQDNCPSAVLEAMSCGLPILYSSSGGIPELVDSSSGVGLYVEESWTKVNVPTNSQIVNGMKQIISLKNKMSDSARRRAVERYDIKDWLRKHGEIIEKLFYTN